MKAIFTSIVLSTLLLSSYSNAQCRKSNVCDDYGQNCRVMDICDSSLDLPSIGIAPLSSFPSLEIKPLPSLSLPPLGTSSCQFMQVNGLWQNVCN